MKKILVYITIVALVIIIVILLIMRNIDQNKYATQKATTDRLKVELAKYEKDIIKAQIDRHKQNSVDKETTTVDTSKRKNNRTEIELIIDSMQVDVEIFRLTADSIKGLYEGITREEADLIFNSTSLDKLHQRVDSINIYFTQILNTDYRIADSLLQYLYSIGIERYNEGEGCYGDLILAEDYITNNYVKYLTKYASDHHHMQYIDNLFLFEDAALVVSEQTLYQWLVDIEQFIRNYPLRSDRTWLVDMYIDKLEVLLFSNMDNRIVYGNSTLKYRDDAVEIYEEHAKKSTDTYTNKIITTFLNRLKNREQMKYSSEFEKDILSMPDSLKLLK